MRALDPEGRRLIDAFFDDPPSRSPDDAAARLANVDWQQKADLLAYWDCRINGCSRTLAEMLALQQAPCLKTDATFLAGVGMGSQFSHSPMEEHIGDSYVRMARSVDPDFSPKGKVYLRGMAAYPGDPRAWVSDRHDIKAACEERNWTVSGAVEHKADSRVFETIAPG